MPDTSVAIIISASITAAVALGGILATVLVGLRQQRKTLEHTATQARLAREADAQREAREAARRRYDRVRTIVDPYIALAGEMRSTLNAWQVVVAPQTFEAQVNLILGRIQAAWALAETQRGNFEIEPGLEEVRRVFERLSIAYNQFASMLATQQVPSWRQLATAKTVEVQTEADLLIETTRKLVARLESEQE